jgi:proteasome accessory factor A
VGEGLYSETALLLRTAATALVVGLIEAGVDVGPSVALRNPVRALRKFSADPLCKAAARIENGSVVRAIDIQRHYLQIAGDNLASLPVWAEPVLNLWKEILDNLESGAEQNEMLRLDWVVRWRLYTKFLQNRGLDWKTMADEASAPALGAIRAELFELDTKFGAVGNQGVFNALDQKGRLRHRIDVAHFPGDTPTRADLRGAVIQQICDNKNRDTFVAEWSYLLNRQENTWLDLTDPFEQNAEWKPKCQPETFRLRRIVNLLE